jgi:hypothetical protein
MTSPPRTKEEARVYRYPYRGVGKPYTDGQCAYSVPVRPHWLNYHQCTRRPGHGPDGLYCKQHAKMVEDNMKRREGWK